MFHPRPAESPSLIIFNLILFTCSSPLEEVIDSWRIVLSFRMPMLRLAMISRKTELHEWLSTRVFAEVWFYTHINIHTHTYKHTHKHGSVTSTNACQGHACNISGACKLMVSSSAKINFKRHLHAVWWSSALMYTCCKARGKLMPSFNDLGS